MTRKKGIIFINAYSASYQSRQVERFVSEFKTRGCDVDVMRNDFFPLEVSGGNLLCNVAADFCLYLDKDKYVAEMLEKSGVRLFNRASAIALCDDKMLTHIALSDSGIPMPHTLAGLLCYDKTASVSSAALDLVEAKLGYPVIVKQSYGSFGKGVFKADDRADLERIAEKLKLEPHLYQKYIAASHGKDLRVIVAGGRVLGGILRRSNGDFRSNVGLGGRAEKTEVPENIRRLAVKAADVLGLDYCGMDFLLDGNAPLVCEVNSNALFDAFEQATGINVAAAYVEHILDRINA